MVPSSVVVLLCFSNLPYVTCIFFIPSASVGSLLCIRTTHHRVRNCRERRITLGYISPGGDACTPLKLHTECKEATEPQGCDCLTYPLTDHAGTDVPNQTNYITLLVLQQTPASYCGSAASPDGICRGDKHCGPQALSWLLQAVCWGRVSRNR
jgi:hypothetical protein